jgi:hypothetical protein
LEDEWTAMTICVRASLQALEFCDREKCTDLFNSLGVLRLTAAYAKRENAARRTWRQKSYKTEERALDGQSGKSGDEEGRHPVDWERYGMGLVGKLRTRSP